ncbi:hypothetical protein GCM10009839_27770 [Catenulispora yoronensis]|uniref:GIY-YIG domain-containing protein n=2 Tax=Catenulispora yoronensis TaxID=450799 RepID=A0ABN2U1Q2_9ACTN
MTRVKPMPGSRDSTYHSAEFRLNIIKAMADQLYDLITQLTPAPLTMANINVLDEKPGIYQLYRGEEIVYVGKADKSLPERLGKHVVKLSGRTVGPDHAKLVDEMHFTCLYVLEDLSAVAPERLMIKRFQAKGEAAWNANGFGRNDPGKERDTSAVKAGHFDALFPINLDVGVKVAPGRTLSEGFLAELKLRLPYNLRYDGSFKSKAGVALTEIVAGDASTTAREAFMRVIQSLPVGWQLTALPGYAILYPSGKTYPSALAWWTKVEGVVHETVGTPEFDTKGSVEDEATGDDEGLSEFSAD